MALGLAGTDLERKVGYTPNYYPTGYLETRPRKDDGYLDVCCFGAIRPLKNHLVQALAAVKLALFRLDLLQRDGVVLMAPEMLFSGE